MKMRKLLHLLLAACLVLVALSPSFFLPKVKAAGTFTDASLTISDSRAAATSVQYDFAMTATSSAAIKQIDIYFCTTSVGACIAPSGLNTGTPIMSANTITGTDESVAKITAQDHTIRVTVGTPLTQDPTDFTMSFTGITNTDDPDSSFYARVTSYDMSDNQLDYAVVASAVLTTQSIYVTADVGAHFTFTVAANNSGNVNSAAIGVTSTASTIPFGALTVDTPKIASHELTIVTNAENGYKITVKSLADPPLVDGSNEIDKFNNANASPATWSGPTSATQNDNTGWFGYTTEDSTLESLAVDRFTSSGGNKWAGFETTPYEIAYSPTPPGDTPLDGVTKVGWQIEVDKYQPPGAYSGSIVLVATPTY